jgi:hypothetical protein|tara:strand:+ start:157 stop:384 length:228 start_codon:yes stop_codon:yes gene_type:complete
MEQTEESVTSSVKNTESNTSTDTDSKKEVTLPTPLPNVLMLGLLFLMTLGIIYAGYVKGDMHLLTVLKNAKEFYD